MIDNDEIEIIPYNTRRTEAFKASVVEMGIALYGEEGAQKERAYIEFDDGMAPLTFSLDAKNVSVIEQEGKIKDFYDMGRFAQSLRKMGYKLFVSRNAKTMRTDPSIIGFVTEWTCKPPTKSVSADGREFLNYNFELKEITNPTPSTSKTPATPSTGTGKPKDKPSPPVSTIDPALIELWKEYLVEILQVPVNEAGVLQAINSKVTDVKNRQALNAVRKKVLELLVREKFLDIDENARYFLRA